MSIGKRFLMIFMIECTLQMVPVDMIAALDMYVDRGQWDKCIQTAEQEVHYFSIYFFLIRNFRVKLFFINMLLCMLLTC